MRRNYILAHRQSRALFLKIGLVLALSAVVLAFRWSISLDNNYQNEDTIEEDTFFEVIPRTRHQQKKPLPPPPPPTNQEVLPPKLNHAFAKALVPEKIEALDFDWEADAQSQMEATMEEIPPPPIPEEKDEAPPFFKIVEEMPVFGPCAGVSAKKDRKVCSDRAIMTYLSAHIKYPAIARENGIEGTVVIRFIIDKTGNVTQAEIIRDIGGGCGNEALRVVRQMPQWRPGIQRHQKVNVQMSLPVKFQLN